MGFFTELGAKRTAADPTGEKHRLTFRLFILIMVLIVGILIIVRADDARAGTQCRGPVSGTKHAALDDPSVTLKAQRWCGTSDGAGARFTTNPDFVRSYTESLNGHFSKWFDSTNASGTGTAPDGDRNVEYKAKWVAAEFCIDIVPPVCGHTSPWGVRIWAWANGNYTIKITTGTEPSGMPRP